MTLSTLVSLVSSRGRTALPTRAPTSGSRFTREREPAEGHSGRQTESDSVKRSRRTIHSVRPSPKSFDPTQDLGEGNNLPALQKEVSSMMTQVLELKISSDLMDEVVEELMRELLPEIERYLRAVNTFRAEGHEPHWRGQ